MAKDTKERILMAALDMFSKKALAPPSICPLCRIPWKISFP